MTRKTFALLLVAALLSVTLMACREPYSPVMPTEPTTDAPTEATTEAATESTTEAPTEPAPVLTEPPNIGGNKGGNYVTTPPNEPPIENENFKDDRVVVIIRTTHINRNRVFTPSDFPGIGVESVIDMMPLSAPGEILQLMLRTRGTDSVLNAISILEQMDIVYVAEPYFEQTPSNW